MPFFSFASWKTFLLLSLTLHSVRGDSTVVTAPQDQSSGQLTAGSSISTLDGGPSVEAAFNPISDPPIHGETTSNKPLHATTGIDMSCSDPNHKPPVKIRARRGNNSPTSCPSFLLPPQDQQQKPPKNPQQPIINDGGEKQGDNAEGPEQPARNLRWRPKVGPLQDPCRSEILALGLIPVCDSGYIGPTTVLTECRYCVWILISLYFYNHSRTCLLISVFPSFGWFTSHSWEDQILFLVLKKKKKRWLMNDCCGRSGIFRESIKALCSAPRESMVLQRSQTRGTYSILSYVSAIHTHNLFLTSFYYWLPPKYILPYFFFPDTHHI